MVNEMVLEIPWPQVPIQAWGINWVLTVFQGAFLVAQMVKESTCNAGDLSSIPGLGRSPEEGRLPSPVFWPGESHGVYSPLGLQRVGHN